MHSRAPPWQRCLPRNRRTLPQPLQPKRRQPRPPKRRQAKQIWPTSSRRNPRRPAARLASWPKPRRRPQSPPFCQIRQRALASRSLSLSPQAILSTPPPTNRNQSVRSAKLLLRSVRLSVPRLPKRKRRRSQLRRLARTTDLPAGDASTGATRKDAVAPAIDNVAAKSQSPTAGQALGNTAAQTKEPANAPSATQPAAGSGASEVDRVRFLQRVSSAFQTADEQGGQIRLRLSPPELGSMRLELSVRNGMMTAHVQTETDAARNMLLDHLPQLRDRLAEHNIKIDHFDVELTNQSRSGTPQNFAGNANQRQQTGPDGAPRPRTSAGGSALAAAPATTIRTVNGRLDITV